VTSSDYTPDKNASMAELFRWRHFSTDNPVRLEYLQSISGISRLSAENVSFVMTVDVSY
jgi:hypothetical protein